MSSTSEIITLIRDAIASDLALSAWCVSKYGNTPTIYVGINIDNPPESENYPLVIIEEITEARGNAQNMMSWIVSIGCGIIDDTIVDATVKVDTTTVSTTKTFSGVADVEAFREKVEDILKSSRFAKLSFNTESIPINLYPEFNSFTFVTVEQIATRRRV